VHEVQSSLDQLQVVSLDWLVELSADLFSSWVNNGQEGLSNVFLLISLENILIWKDPLHPTVEVWHPA
jgi:hypothetical protein